MRAGAVLRGRDQIGTRGARDARAGAVLRDRDQIGIREASGMRAGAVLRVTGVPGD